MSLEVIYFVNTTGAEREEYPIEVAGSVKFMEVLLEIGKKLNLASESIVQESSQAHRQLVERYYGRMDDTRTIPMLQDKSTRGAWPNEMNSPDVVAKQCPHPGACV